MVANNIDNIVWMITASIAVPVQQSRPSSKPNVSTDGQSSLIIVNIIQDNVTIIVNNQWNFYLNIFLICYVHREPKCFTTIK